MTRQEKNLTVDNICKNTWDAYSRDRYHDFTWSRIAGVLLDEGYDKDQVIHILYSKIMRWIADECHPVRHMSARSFLEVFNRRYKKYVTEWYSCPHF